MLFYIKTAEGKLIDMMPNLIAANANYTVITQFADNGGAVNNA